MKKFLPYILILVALFGLFGLTHKASAQTGGPSVVPTGTCSNPTYTTKEGCEGVGATWTPYSSSGTGTTTGNTQTTGTKTAFEDEIKNKTTCDITKILPGCLVVGAYYVFYVVPAFVLAKVAYFFNVLTFVTLSGELFKQDFVPKAWGVVRDLSNIFFLLILLYVAVKIILDIGGHGVKQTIARVVVVALLINFSMFFTQIVIDTSNVLALVFYNKLNVNTIAGGEPRPYDSIKGEKDIAGGMVAAFDPTTPLKKDFFEETKKIYLNGTDTGKTESEVPAGTMIALILMSGFIMCFAIYALVVSGLSFVGRLIELWVLIIFSPFAFMSSTIHELEGIKYLGWKAWLQRLIDVSFMAPIFMFFLYFIFLLISSNIFTAIIPRPSGVSGATGAITMLLGVILPMLLILQLLLKATEFAKKGSGKFGEIVMTGAKVVGGLALGAATAGAGLAVGAAAGGAAAAGTELLGGLAAKKLKEQGETWRSQQAEGGMSGYIARMKLKAADYGSKASFDVRKTSVGQTFAKKTGINMENASIIGLGSKEGGYEGAKKRQAEEQNREWKNNVKTKMKDKEVVEWSKKRVEEYEKTKEKARTKRMKNGLIGPAAMREWEERYQKDNGPAPIMFSSAKELNAYRLKQFQANMGNTGLLASAATSAVKMSGKYVDKDNYLKDKTYAEEYKKKTGKDNVEFNEELAKKINDARVKMAKMAIGGAFAIGTGGIGGAAIGTAIGAGSVFGGIAGAASVATVGGGKVLGDIDEKRTMKKWGIKSSTETGNEKFIDDMKKEGKKMTGVTDKLEKLNNLLEKESKKSDIVKKNADGELIVQEEKLTEEIARENANQRGLQSRMDALNRLLAEKGSNKAIQDDIRAVTTDMFNSAVRLEQLNTIKGAPEKIEKLKHEVEALEEKNKPTEPKQKGSSGGGGHSSKKPEAPKHEEKHEEAHDNNSGGGHDAHGHH